MLFGTMNNVPEMQHETDFGILPLPKSLETGTVLFLCSDLGVCAAIYITQGYTKILSYT